ncbi:aldo/keto reductase family oxidoreductase [Gangjinia marincola]|uniref:Aldo/keto reductase family oxidoreductase n=1 Tax=Gangjinia marincola TaxID=578463 RepID=A0ABP3XTB3_9FLAO
MFSRIIQGVMTWGEWGKKFNRQEMISQLNFCIEQGVTTFDHADIYGGYTNEEHFGTAFAEANIQREDIQLISKCGIQYKAETRPQNEIKHYQYDKEYIITSTERSLKLLQTDYLDLLLLHRPSPLMHPDEIAEAVTQLKTQGKINAFGVSNFSVSQMSLIQSRIPIDANQIEFSLTAHNALHDGTLDYMMEYEITPMCWSPLGKVFNEETAQAKRIHEVLDKLSDRYSGKKDQLLLAWILKHPAAIHPVIGTTTKERVKDAKKATEIELEIQDWFELLVASQGHKVP